MLRQPGIPSTIIDIGTTAGSSTRSEYCIHAGATCAPASSRICSIPRFRASFTPQGITVSPRTRSSYSTLDSKTVTLRPADAKAYAREEPAIPPPTITMSEMSPTTSPLYTVADN